VLRESPRASRMGRKDRANEQRAAARCATHPQRERQQLSPPRPRRFPSMKTGDAVALIRDAVAGRGGIWADIGAGRGTFTRALDELLVERGAPGPETRIYAVDRDPLAVAELEAWASSNARNVEVIQADFTLNFSLPSPPDGILLANALHFVPDAGAVLHRLTRMMRPGGRVALVEYDLREANHWVPFPVSIADLRALASSAGLTRFTVSERRPSTYHGIIYSAYADWIE
jgi:trans-aconitate methyltransferase